MRRLEFEILIGNIPTAALLGLPLIESLVTKSVSPDGFALIAAGFLYGLFINSVIGLKNTDIIKF